MTAWAWHQLVHLAIVVCLVGIGYALAVGSANLVGVLLVGAVWFTYRAHRYHHALLDRD